MNRPLHSHNRHGFSLVEIIVYISILTLIFLVIAGTLLSFTSSYRVLAALRTVEHSATEGMERMTRDIRQATTVDVAGSTLDTTPGILTIVNTQGNTSTTTKFYVSSGRLQVDVNGTLLGPLTTSDVTVTSLMFRKITSTNSQAVKIDMTLEATRGTVTESRSYHTTIVLKGS